MLIATRYQTRPTEPTPLEAVLFTEENVRDIADWIRRVQGPDGMSRPGAADVLVESDEQDACRIRVPAPHGWWAFTPVSYVAHFGGGRFRSYSVADFEQRFEAAPLPADAEACSCLSPQVYGSAEGDGPMVWESDCKTCGRTLRAETLVEADVWLDAGSVAS